MSIIKSFDPAHLLHSYPTLNSLAGSLRQAMQLEPLTATERRQYGGQWFHNALDFASRAGRAREDHADLLNCLPYRGPDIEAQRKRVAFLEKAHLLFLGFTKAIADTLLKERATLYNMSTMVLRTLETTYQHPYWAIDQKAALADSIKLLRKEFDRRNKKVSLTKRAHAAAQAETEAPQDSSQDDPRLPE